jgi:hypothetical protein
MGSGMTGLPSYGMLTTKQKSIRNAPWDQKAKRPADVIGKIATDEIDDSPEISDGSLPGR